MTVGIAGLGRADSGGREGLKHRLGGPSGLMERDHCAGSAFQPREFPVQNDVCRPNNEDELGCWALAIAGHLTHAIQRIRGSVNCSWPHS